MVGRLEGTALIGWFEGKTPNFIVLSHTNAPMMVEDIPEDYIMI